jgi:hypothetical protein
MCKLTSKELLAKTGLNNGNIHRIIVDDDHIINIEEEKGLSKKNLGG